MVISSGSVSEATHTPQKNEDTTQEPLVQSVTKRYNLPIPEGDTEEVLVKIVVDGEAVYEKTHKRGEVASVDITGYGELVIEAYIDGEVVNRQAVNFR